MKIWNMRVGKKDANLFKIVQTLQEDRSLIVVWTNNNIIQMYKVFKIVWVNRKDRDIQLVPVHDEMYFQDITPSMLIRTHNISILFHRVACACGQMQLLYDIVCLKQSQFSQSHTITYLHMRV